MSQRLFSYAFCFVMIGLLGALTQCSSKQDKDLEEAAKEKRAPKSDIQRMQAKNKGYVFGEPLFALGSKKTEDSNIGVNSYLWRASLDVLSPLPKVRADPFGGLIMTDWYSPHGDTHERFKMEIIIIGRQLRSDALRVSIFRQHFQNSEWVDVPVSNDVVDQVEETILKRARDIRVQEEK